MLLTDYDNEVVVSLPDGATRTVFRSHTDTAPPHEKVCIPSSNCTRMRSTQTIRRDLHTPPMAQRLHVYP